MVGKAVGFVGKSYFGTDSAHGTRFSYFIRWVRFGQIKHFTYVTIKMNILMLLSPSLTGRSIFSITS